MTARALAAAGVLIAAGCVVEPAPLEGAPCPCAEGYLCCSDLTCAAEPDDCYDIVSEPLLGLRHAMCERRIDEVPPGPRVERDEHGRPAFDLWRDHHVGVHGVLCYPPAAPQCGGGQICTVVAPDEGLCAPGRVDVEDLECEEGEEVLTWLYGQCRGCFPPEVHFAACSVRFAGIDCRAWPYGADGLPGTICATHLDCESGLLCGDTGEGFGLCHCPGESPPLRDDCENLLPF